MAADTDALKQRHKELAELIEERERAQKHKPSNPQISVGSAVKAKLEELERQLAGPGALPTVAEVK